LGDGGLRAAVHRLGVPIPTDAAEILSVFGRRVIPCDIKPETRSWVMGNNPAVLTTVHNESEQYMACCAENPGWEEAVGERHRAAHAALMRRVNRRNDQRRRFAAAVGPRRAETVACVCPRRVNGPAGRPRAQASRSSAASGDGGDDDPGEPEPPWLPGHGDIDGVGDPPPDPIPNIAARVAIGAAIDRANGFPPAWWF
jgi:hypothetical protein